MENSILNQVKNELTELKAKIKELKEKQIAISKFKFYLYFGR